jgi:hypothetical protein
VARGACSTYLGARREVAERKRYSPVGVETAGLVRGFRADGDTAEAAKSAAADPRRKRRGRDGLEFGDALGQRHRTEVTSGEREVSIANEGTAIVERY